MKICVIGVGYVGLVTAACLADFGNEVVCVDNDKKKIEALNKSQIDFYELGLKELVAKNIKAKRLFFTSILAPAFDTADLLFIAVGTPPLANGDADLTAVKNVAKQIAEKLRTKAKLKTSFKVVALKSTVPVGTSDKITEIFKKHRVHASKYDIVSNPEFLREGHAVYDFLHPDRIVIGSLSRRACNLMAELYRPLNARLIFVDHKSAELIKYASNAFLATKISFINEIANICDKIGADVKSVAEGMGYDSRISHAFLRAGIGFGGSCLPKDLSALSFLARKNGYSPYLLESVKAINNFQKENFLKRAEKVLGGFHGKKIGIWGLSFKPQTDDIREAPALFIINELHKKGAQISACDPMSANKFSKIFPMVTYFSDPYQAAKNCDAIFILTEWNEFRDIDYQKLAALMRRCLIFDGRNIYNSSVLRGFGFEYFGIGRGE